MLWLVLPSTSSSEPCTWKWTNGRQNHHTHFLLYFWADLTDRPTSVTFCNAMQSFRRMILDAVSIFVFWRPVSAFEEEWNGMPFSLQVYRLSVSGTVKQWFIMQINVSVLEEEWNGSHFCSLTISSVSTPQFHDPRTVSFCSMILDTVVILSFGSINAQFVEGC